MTKKRDQFNVVVSETVKEELYLLSYIRSKVEKRHVSVPELIREAILMRLTASNLTSSCFPSTLDEIKEVDDKISSIIGLWESK